MTSKQQRYIKYITSILKEHNNNSFYRQIYLDLLKEKGKKNFLERQLTDCIIQYMSGKKEEELYTMKSVSDVMYLLNQIQKYKDDWSEYVTIYLHKLDEKVL